eukprot:gene13234-biopygen10555
MAVKKVENRKNWIGQQQNSVKNKSVTTSVLLYGCKAWTYNEEIEKKINACEMWCNKKMLGIKWTDRRANESVRQQVANMAGSVQCGLLEIAKERKLRLFGHVTRHPGDLELANTIIHGRDPGTRA